ncbi:MAG: Na/Pi symporter [Candidatus Pacearchaeota archaeon]|nr:Na/Pi symporter [Candidatus Pacearchaeota archaeon]
MLETIIFFIVGIVLFLFGVFLLSEKLKFFIREKIITNLRKITRKPLYGFLFGAISSAISQSSSAITVLTLALVSSGLLGLYYSLPILFGANVGTTLTVNLVAIGVTRISFLFVLIGFVLLFIKKTKRVGEIIFYVGIVFFGLFLISYSIEPLKYTQQRFFSVKNPYLAFFYSIIFTAAVQSSAITISSAIILAQHNLLELPAAIAIVLGANIGTTITALITCIGTSINGKRTAFAHFFFNVFGAFAFLPFIWPLNSLLDSFAFPIGLKVSLFHFFFNFVMAIAFLLLLKPYYKFIKTILPGRESRINFLPFHLDKNFLEKPKEALERTKKRSKNNTTNSRKILCIVEKI